MSFLAAAVQPLLQRLQSYLLQLWRGLLATVKPQTPWTPAETQVGLRMPPQTQILELCYCDWSPPWSCCCCWCWVHQQARLLLMQKATPQEWPPAAPIWADSCCWELLMKMEAPSLCSYARMGSLASMCPTPYGQEATSSPAPCRTCTVLAE